MAALRLEDAFRFLLGKWRVEREVSGTATMTGTVDVRACSEDVAEYGERMQVQTEAGATFAGSVRYTVRRTSRGFALEFPHTGALFQEVEFSRAEGGELRGSAVHDCEEDRYESMYVLGPRREMLVQHAVTGPRKDYVSVARFVRVGGVGAEFGRATWSAVKVCGSCPLGAPVNPRRFAPR